MTRGWTIPACHDFYPRPPRGGRLVLPDGWEVAPYFYPRPPRGGRQGKKWSDKEVIKISIHALREEGDQRNLCTGQHSRYFYPRPPRGGRRAEESVVFGVKAISIHALREEGDVQTQTATRLGDAFLSTPSARRATVLRDTFDYDISISIHALREEGDVPPRASFSSSFYFYPRPPRGGRLNPPTQEEKAHQFLSTPSARRATTRTTYADRAQMISIHALREEGDNIGSLSPGPTQNFYPRPPRGGRPHSSTVRLSGGAFLSTPSARRATSARGSRFVWSARFLSTPSARRATRPGSTPGLPKTISIHALREEGDQWRRPQALLGGYFYPRPPRGGRPFALPDDREYWEFLSTPSARRATFTDPEDTCECWISIHALREEGDGSVCEVR